jgi:MoaA/NifB/PqqE/SkfB family radical SAM enzyme
MKLKSPPLLIPWKGKDIPHGAIEVNQKCNLQCDGCYKNKFDLEKPIQQIKDEIDQLAGVRNLASMTLTGGEPTLHKNLLELIKYISSKNIRPLLLTNGTNLTDSLLKKYKKAGLARIGIHIDKHQNIRPDYYDKIKNESSLNKLRKFYLDLCEKNKIGTSLQLTIYRDSLNEIPDVINFSRKLSENNAGIFFTLYSPDVNLKNEQSKHKLKNLELSNKEIIDFMFEKEKALPTMYIPSVHNKDSYRWLFYTSFITSDKSGNSFTLHFNPKYKKLLEVLIKLQKIMKGRYSFDDPRTLGQNYFFLFLYCISSFPNKDFIKSCKFLFKSLINENVKTFNLIFQEGPKKIEDKKYDTCFNCPDVTVRNGKIIPICIADFVEPILK